MQQRLLSVLEGPIAFGHRGARAHARESTLDSFALALTLSATGLETIVARSYATLTDGTRTKRAREGGASQQV